MGAKEKPEAAKSQPDGGGAPTAAEAAERAKSKRKRKQKKRLTKLEKEQLRVEAVFEDLRRGFGPRATKFVLTRRPFLLRNVRTARIAFAGIDGGRGAAVGADGTAAVNGSGAGPAAGADGDAEAGPAEFSAEVFATKLRELKAGGRAVKTRNLLSAETDEVLDRTAQLTHLLLGVHEALCKLRHEETGRLLARQFQKLPSQKRHAAFYEMTKKPLALEQSTTSW